MIKSVPLLPLIFFAAISPLFAQVPGGNANRQIVTPIAVPSFSSAKTKGNKAIPLTETAFVRVLHAVPSGPKVDVFVGSLKLASNRGFTGITSYIAVRKGKTPVKVLATGTTSPVIVTDSFNFKPGKHYTVAVYGKKSPVLLFLGFNAPPLAALVSGWRLVLK